MAIEHSTIPFQTTFVFTMVENNFEREWRNTQEIRDWLTNLKEPWQFLATCEETVALYAEIESFFANVLAEIEHLEKRLASGGRGHELHSPLDESIREMLMNYDIVLPTSKIFQFMEWMKKEKNPTYAAQALLTVFDTQSKKEVYKRLEHQFDWFLFTSGRAVKSTADGNQFQRYEDICAAWDNQLLNYQSTVSENTRIIETITSNTSQQTVALNEELKNAKATLTDFMTLREPVAYWQGKQKRHAKLTLWAVGITFSLVVLLACLLVPQIYSIKANLKAEAKAESVAKAAAQKAATVTQLGTSTKDEVEIQRVDNWHLDLAVFLLGATLGFWAIRLSVRYLLSQIHLENDSAERVVMTQTYLALKQDGSLPAAAETRNLVLSALFRPSGDGIVKDEGIPVSLIDLLTRK